MIQIAKKKKALSQNLSRL